ncbi:MAG: hypothetical protein CM15mP103_09690 [Gammaproteobacteria bacterium]|nr:MAG: hypothetical protein CM15mP103_09690 [Gammaproteobacteria bacterium]
MIPSGAFWVGRFATPLVGSTGRGSPDRLFSSGKPFTLQFFPGTDRVLLKFWTSNPDGASIEDSLALVTQVDGKLRSEPLVRRVDWVRGPPEFFPKPAR